MYISPQYNQTLSALAARLRVWSERLLKNVFHGGEVPAAAMLQDRGDMGRGPDVHPRWQNMAWGMLHEMCGMCPHQLGNMLTWCLASTRKSRGKKWAGRLLWWPSERCPSVCSAETWPLWSSKEVAFPWLAQDGWCGFHTKEDGSPQVRVREGKVRDQVAPGYREGNCREESPLKDPPQRMTPWANSTRHICRPKEHKTILQQDNQGRPFPRPLRELPFHLFCRPFPRVKGSPGVERRL
jgi:hypothetical protein